MIMGTKKICITWLFLVSATSVFAENGNLIIPDNPKWKEECATSCHIGYPPQLMTEESWYLLMERLDKHFGANVAMDSNDNKEILEFLLNNSGIALDGKSSTTSLRITDTPWFVFEHRHIMNIWSDSAIRSSSNCAVCHINAERGDWSKLGVRFPRLRGKRDEHGALSESGK